MRAMPLRASPRVSSKGGFEALRPDASYLCRHGAVGSNSAQKLPAFLVTTATSSGDAPTNTCVPISARLWRSSRRRCALPAELQARVDELVLRVGFADPRDLRRPPRRRGAKRMPTSVGDVATADAATSNSPIMPRRSMRHRRARISMTSLPCSTSVRRRYARRALKEDNVVAVGAARCDCGDVAASRCPARFG